MNKIAPLLPLLSLIIMAIPNYQVQILNTGTITEGPGNVYMNPSEVIIDAGTLHPGGRWDYYHGVSPNPVAQLTLNLARPITLSLENFQHWKSFDCWIEIDGHHYFPTDAYPVETQNIPAGTHDLWFDCTAFVKDDITEPVSGEVILRVLDGNTTVGMVKVEYSIIL